MVEFTMTFSGPKKCAYCNGPIGEVAYFNEDGAYCDIVCAEGFAVEKKGQDMHGPPLTPLEQAEEAVIEAARALEKVDRESPTTLFAFATMDSAGGKAVRDFIYSVRALEAVSEPAAEKRPICGHCGSDYTPSVGCRCYDDS